MPPKQIAEPSPPAHDAETGEIIDDGEGRFRIPLEVVDNKPNWSGWCSDFKDALLGAEAEDDLNAIAEANKDTLIDLGAGGNGGRKAADRLRGLYTAQQIELRRKAAAA
jgi:hypothetical protein